MESFSGYARHRIAVFGGSFNPFHNGHLEVVKCLAKRFRKVWVLPCGNHPFGKELAPSNDRYRMAVLGTMGLLMTSVKRFELNSPNVSYTSRTVKMLSRNYPSSQFSWVIGEDSLEHFDEWRDAEMLKQEVDFVIVSRKKLDVPFGYNLVCKTPKVSSSKIRSKLSKGNSVEKLVPERVADYIKEHKLYRD